MCPICTTLLLVAALLGLFYIYLVWNFGYWKRRGINEAKSYPFVGSLPSRFTKKRNVIYDIDDIYNEYKHTENIVGIFNCRTPQLLILSLEYVQKIYVNDFKYFHDNEFSKMVDRKRDVIFGNNPSVLTGEEWKERRAELTPGLAASRINVVYPVSLEVCKSFSKYIKLQMKMASKDGIEVKQLSLRYTTEVVSDCVLGIKAKSFTDNPTPICSMIRRVFDQSYWFMLYGAIANLVPQIRKFYTARLFSEEAEKFFTELMQNSIDLRRKMPINAQRTNFLNYILQLQDRKQLTTMDLTAHTITFMTDGFETTAVVLAHTLLLLARYPEVQQKLRAEIGQEALSFEQLQELPYIDACIHECMRIFSPQLMARKVCTEPYEFVNKNGATVQVHPGDVVVIPSHSLHHDAEFYDNPEQFQPERFLEENGGVKKYRDMGAFLVFGHGPRVCFGMRFALTQIKAALVQIVRDFNIKVNPRTRKDNQLDDIYFMANLKGGIWLEFEERN